MKWHTGEQKERQPKPILPDDVYPITIAMVFDDKSIVSEMTSKFPFVGTIWEVEEDDDEEFEASED